ncbi:endo alpha-1,4 polygalactosaminidase [Magnetospira thiophila]
MAGFDGMRGFLGGLVLLASCALSASPALSQADDGQVRAQGKVVDRNVGQEENQRRLLAAPKDPREAMRTLVQDISKFTRRYKRNFLLIAQNPLGLSTKTDLDDPTALLPARTFLQSIDGILQEGVWYGIPDIGKPVTKNRNTKALTLLNLAKQSAVPVFIIDYVSTAKQAYEVLDKAHKAGFVAAPAFARGQALNSLPKVPSRPYQENAQSVLSLKDVRNFFVLPESTGLGRQDEFALKVHDTNYDAVIVDVFHGRDPLTKQAVETLKYKKSGARRLVLAYMNVGVVGSYRYYWKENWKEGSPSWIDSPYPGHPDSYFAQYWNPEWQQMLSGDTNSYVYGIIAQGFDGVVLDGLDVYHFFEGDIEADPL